MTWQHEGGAEEMTSNAIERAAIRFDQEVRQATARHEHYWLALVGFRVTPPLDMGVVLDHENIRVAPSVGCFICETPFARHVPKRCPGEPR